MIGTYTATCDEGVSQLSVGSHPITAFFQGDSTYSWGSLGYQNQTVGKGATTTTITSPAPGASVQYGDEGQNSLNVLVSAAAGVNLSPSNSVNLYAGAPGPGSLLCTAFLNGMGGGQSDGSCYLNYNQRKVVAMCSRPFTAATTPFSAGFCHDRPRLSTSRGS